MKTISSKWTFISKKVFPVVWFGFLTFFLITSLTNGQAEKEPMILIAPIAMSIFGFVLMKKLVWDLMDEVIDHGEYLVVKFRGQQESIYLANVVNVSASTNQNPPRVTLRLRSPCKFGQEIPFSPTAEFSINPFKKNKVAEELILRVDKARTRN